MERMIILVVNDDGDQIFAKELEYTETDGAVYIDNPIHGLFCEIEEAIEGRINAS